MPKKNRGRIIASFILIAVLAGTASGVAQMLPVRPQEKILAPETPAYGGVIDLWLVETFYPGKGSFQRWLANSAAAFEKRNKGVFINIRMVEPKAAVLAIDENENLPDAMLCGGGIFDGAALLKEVKQPSGLIPAFADALKENDETFGIPVAAGAYTILYNAERLSSAGIGGAVTPETLNLLYQKAQAKPKRAESFAVNGAATEYISPSMAFLCMMEPEDGALAYLSGNIFAAEGKTAWADFVLDRKSAAYVCTQKEIFRIRQLEAGNSAFPWRTHEAVCEYTDQLLALYVLGKKMDEGKEAAILAFAEFLLSEERQSALADIGAFSVRSGLENLYPAESSLHFMEMSLKSEGLITPNMLGWRAFLKEVSGAEKSAAGASQRLSAVKYLLEKMRNLE